ncbi:aminoglycoside phosphotransferase family protein [Streptomyces sp. DSM 44915]|uniref:Aminoglycoside phosphotransferase family protein n=1 Tax=Streptomyces chisholmiae TaxID=3075540 RepID=A0ABU2JXK8_9ACTN|nr:aminoglycoside phosphotransferase family protein [Streptomyces sp. DSM 44915]MDT0269730.1 aminoglycoside phosphotransferase family protein [Streptomyces sp. DSM 44915]
MARPSVPPAPPDRGPEPPAGPAADWPRVARLDAERVTEGLFRATGVRLLVLGPFAGGQVGAARVRWPDGRPAVLKWRPGVAVAAFRRGPLAVLEALRATGYPAPATELLARVDDAVVMVQELLPGSEVARLDGGLLTRVLGLNAAQADVLAGRPEVPSVNLHLAADGPGFCLHEPLRRHSRRSLVLADWIAEVAAEHPDDLLPGDDAVHFDFHPGNLLAAGGALTGVVDWDGAARGDRALDLVTLRFGLHGQEPGPGVVDRLDAVLAGLPAGTLRRCWAHMSLRMVDWAIRHHTPSDVDHWLDLAERRTG